MDTFRKTMGEDVHIRVKVFSTGGTIEKIYDEHAGILHNMPSRFDHILSQMRLPSVQIDHHGLMGKDSLDMTPADRQLIKESVEGAMSSYDAILIVHGTDTLEETGELLCSELKQPEIPIILTGAMRPFEFRDTDAFQNVYESLIACRLVAPGVYCVMHSKVLRFPGVRKDHGLLTFVKGETCAVATDAC
ncbi:MAG TPA: asparaginase [Phycisphaerae bacterium]|nr:asparaginase [Phycisphaerales bacterium]HNO76785.1 asparaginase [Phycisphaerae bacterium]